MTLDVACSLLTTYFIYIRESNRRGGGTAFAGFVYFCAYILRFHLLP